MKIEPGEFDVGNVRVKDLKVQRGIAFANQIWPRLETLVGSDKGVVVDIREDFPDVKHWPTVEENRNLPLKEQIFRKYQHGVRCVIHALNALLREKTRNPNQRYFSVQTYVGGGKIVFWWKYVKLKKKKSQSA